MGQQQALLIKVVDAKNNPVGFANISILHKIDSTKNHEEILKISPNKTPAKRLIRNFKNLNQKLYVKTKVSIFFYKLKQLFTN